MQLSYALCIGGRHGSQPLLVAVALSLAMQAAVVYPPAGNLPFHTVALPAPDVLAVAALNVVALAGLGAVWRVVRGAAGPPPPRAPQPPRRGPTAPRAPSARAGRAS